MSSKPESSYKERQSSYKEESINNSWNADFLKSKVIHPKEIKGTVYGPLKIEQQEIRNEQKISFVSLYFNTNPVKISVKKCNPKIEIILDDEYPCDFTDYSALVW